MADLNALVEEKINSDTDFLTSLELLSDEEKNQAMAAKRQELILAEYSKQEEIAKNQKIRAEKAEKELKTSKPAEGSAAKNEPNLSLKDIRALQDVHDEDVDELTDYAKFKGISVAEAKKLPEIQSLLKTKEEMRKTALAASVSGNSRGSSKVSGLDILEKAKSGDFPEDDDSIKRIMEEKTRLAKEALKQGS